MDILLTGLSGLQSYQQAIEVTSHNIANATTPGYTRQRAELTTNTPESVQAGMMGRGVTVDAIKRLASDLLIERLRQSRTEGSRLEQMDQVLGSAELIFNEPGENGLSATIDQLFASFEDLANNPESSALRTTVVAQLGVFTDTMNSIGTQLAQQRADVADALTGQVQEVNQLTTEISTLNQQIREQMLRGAAPNDLLDRRDTLIGKLSEKLELTVRTDLSDGTVRIDSGGRLLVGTSYAEQLTVGENHDGTVALLLSDRTAVTLTGGAIGGLVDLHDRVLPGLLADMDQLASALAFSLNARQSTGTSNATRISSFLSDYAIDGALTGTNLDDAGLAQTATNGLGIPATFLPDFTDAAGNLTARNLTINVFDPASGTAQKYIVRYDPTTAGGTRSLDDLVSAINSGRSTPSGGFTLYPPSGGGIPGLTAKIVTVDGGAQLELTASGGRTIDFSKALDLAPADTVWASPDITISGTEPLLANQRLTFRVNGSNLQAFTSDPTSGTDTLYAQVPIAGLSAVPAAFGIGGLQVAVAAGNFHDGDTFAVDFDLDGIIATTTGTHVQAHAWTAGDATLKVQGRYTGAVTYTPGREWSMRVVTPGTIGSTDDPPLVEFTFYTGPAEAPVEQKLQKVLDDAVPAGSPVAIADGVYVTFAAGTLTTTGNRLSWIVDAEPDQAGLLPALGINGLFQGSSAATLAISDEIQADAARVAVGQTRSAGDNANLLDMAGVRKAKLFSNGTASVDEFYHTTVANLGVQVAQTKRLQDTQDSLTASIENQRQQVSGVSIDEEVTYLILQQQAYTACARLITTARENIQTLLDLVR